MVPAKGPCIESFPELPPDALSWNRRVETTPKQKDGNYQEITEDIVSHCKEGRSINVFCTGVHSNRNREDGKQLGAASAVLYSNGRDWKHKEEVFRETMTESDAALQALIPALELLHEFLSSHHTESPHNVFILAPSNYAINQALDPSPHVEQATLMMCLEKLGELMNLYPNMTVRLLWLPRGIPFIRFT
jgi:hypothetical protein